MLQRRRWPARGLHRDFGSGGRSSMMRPDGLVRVVQKKARVVGRQLRRATARKVNLTILPIDDVWTACRERSLPDKTDTCRAHDERPVWLQVTLYPCPRFCAAKARRGAEALGAALTDARPGKAQGQRLSASRRDKRLHKDAGSMPRAVTATECTAEPFLSSEWRTSAICLLRR